MNYSAYFCILLESPSSGPFPRVIRAGIFSAPAESLTVMGEGTMWANITSAYGDSYQEASDSLKSYIMGSRHLKWASFWVDDSPGVALARSLVCQRA